MTTDLDKFAKTLARLSRAEGSEAIAEHLAATWIDTARRTMGHDTNQLDDRTQVTSFNVTRGGYADVRLKADTPYAGFHNYGTRYQAPNRFWDAGYEAAQREARNLDGRVSASIERALTSGGVWNPRRL